MTSCTLTHASQNSGTGELSGFCQGSIARDIFLNPTSGVCMKHGRLGARRRKPSRSQVARKVCPKARGWKVLGEVNPGEPDFSHECHWRDEKLQGRHALRETTSKLRFARVQTQIHTREGDLKWPRSQRTQGQLQNSGVQPKVTVGAHTLRSSG
jgi:hypothetical protein